MTKLVPVAMAVSALAAATAVGLASPAFSQGVPRVECYQSWVPAIQNCHAVSNDLGYGAWGYVSPRGRFAPAPTLAQYGPPQSPGIGPNGDARYGLHNEAPGGVYNEAPGMGAPGRCRLVITHRRGPNGSVTVRRRICY
jgi:hypothetical protein